MRRLRTDLPYTFRPPRMNRWLRPLVLAVNRRRQLRGHYRIRRIVGHGFERVADLHRDGHSLVLAPNHSDHSDPHVLIELCARHGMHPHFMGAREIFEVSALNTWALQLAGVFSVDRDGPDLAAIKTAMALVDAGEPLVMFPEGEIYHHHRRIDPLNEGVASILLKAANRLQEGRKAYLVPVALRFHHPSEAERTFCERLSRLEDRIGWMPKPSMPVVDRVVRLAIGVLTLKETEFLGEAGHGDAMGRLGEFCENLLSDVESRYAKDAKAETPPERVRALRYRIRRRLLDSDTPPDATDREQLLEDLDRVFVALQAHSYIGDYLSIDPTLDRTAEMIMKLEEDLLGFPNYPVDRTAEVTAGEPIAVSDLLADGTLPAKAGAGLLTAMLEERLVGMLR